MVRSRACLLLLPWARLCKPLVERAGYSSATQLSPLLTALPATSHAGGQPASPVFPPHHLSFARDRWLSTSSTSLHASSKESEADLEASTNSNSVGNVSGSKEEPAKPKELRMSLQEALSSLVDAAVGMVEDNNLAGAISVLKEGIATFEPTFPASRLLLLGLGGLVAAACTPGLGAPCLWPAELPGLATSTASSGRHLLSPLRCMFSAALQPRSSHLPGCGSGLVSSALPWALPLPLAGWLGPAACSALVRLAGGGVLGPRSEAIFSSNMGPELGELYNQVALLSLVAGDVEEAARHA
ncbi:hypothetical protein QJQ45_016140, partial [Haematococcus lacustris]